MDSGQTWQAASLPARANDVLFLSPTVGLAVSDRTIWHTADGARDWQPVWRLPASLFVSDTYFLTSQQVDVAFGRADSDPTGINLLAASGSSTWAVFNEGAGCAMPRCSSYLVLSQDGGMHWRLKTQESPNGAYGSTGPQPVVTELATSPQGLFAVGLSGNDLSLVPPGGGAEDVFAKAATAVQISAISSDGQGGVWLASPNASLLYRSQADASFRPVWPPLTPTLGVQFVTREIGYGMALVAGRYSLLATRDGGRSWEMVHSFADTPSGFAFTGTGAGYVVATTLSMPRAILGQLLRTGDGGKTWRVVYRIGDAAGWLSRVNLQAFSADDVLQGLPHVRLSRDGGKRWRIRGSVPFSGAQAMLATWFLSPRSGWALDAQTGGLYRTVSGGAGWRKVGRLPPSSFAAIDFVNRRDGWILAPGPQGRQSLLRTTDGGMHWSEEAMPQSFALLMYGPADRALSFVGPRVGYLDTNSGVYRTSDGGRIWSPAR